jgi:molecular chaperone DnaK (HSP70)
VVVYGIDLGSTSSRIAGINAAGRPVVLTSAVGENDTPSVVYFESPENAVVGREAKDCAGLFPVELIKRQMGQDVHYSFHGKDYTPESISALILRELARAAQEQTGEEVRDVVITVPAYFGTPEREATRKAGKIAGLNVLAVLDEPVAVALDYQRHSEKTGTQHIFIYDLGGGTFDTTVVRIDGENIQIVCTDGSHHLGGADWDGAIIDFLLRGFGEQYPQLDPIGDEQFMQELATSAERLKKALSATTSRKCTVRFGDSIVQFELTRDHLEQLTSELLERAMEITERTITAARQMGVERFDDVLLVGSMTLTPTIARTLKARFGLEARLQDPHLAVAKGAALFALMKKVKVSMPNEDEPETPKADQPVTDQLGVDTTRTAQAVATVAASSALLSLIEAFAAKDANDVYSSLRRLNLPIRPQNANSSPQSESVVCIADKGTKLLLALPSALSSDYQQTLHHLLERLVYHAANLPEGWLNIRPSSEGAGWNVQLTDEIPRDSIILEGPPSMGTSDLRHNQRVSPAVESENKRINELERERKLLREIVKYLANEITP